MNKIVNLVNKISLPIIAVIILIVFVIFSRECRRDDFRPPPGTTLVSDSFIDSLKKVALMPPDTIWETITIKGETVYVPGEIPEPIIIDAETKAYSDSIVNDSVSVWVDITVRGEILKWDWRYQPVIIENTVTIEKPVPFPVPYEVVVDRVEVYGSLGVGGNQSAFMLSPQLDLITKKDNIYGLQYMRLGQENFYLFKLGTKIRLRR